MIVECLSRQWKCHMLLDLLRIIESSGFAKAEWYWQCSYETVHYKYNETVNFCGFRCATMSPLTIIYENFVFSHLYCL